MPSRLEDGYDLSKLGLFTKTLFYVRENYPEDTDRRSRELLVLALEAVPPQEKEVTLERDPASPPLWVTLTVSGQPCTLNIERVDAVWTLRSTLQNAFRFLQGNLGRLPAAESEARLMGIEIAATNGMLSGLDRGSRLLDVDTYRAVRGHLPTRSNLPRADTGGIHPADASSASGAATAAFLAARRIGPKSTVGYLRLRAFSPGISDEVERGLARLAGEGSKGLVLDLRDNTGGLLNEAIKVADAFVKAGRLVSIVDKKQRGEVVAHDGGHEPGGPLVVLVNRQTAAGSEVVAAAIKDLGRGVVLGEPTAGAGSIRVLFDIRKAFTPSKSPARPASSDFIQDVIDGVAPPAPPPPAKPDPNDSKDDLLGLVLKTGRLLAAGGAEIEGVGVQPDIQPACLVADQPRADEDCLLRLAQDVVIQARDPQRATLLSTARALASPVIRPSGGAPPPRSTFQPP